MATKRHKKRKNKPLVRAGVRAGLQLGPVRLSEGIQPGRVWIQHFDGEGADVCAERLGRIVEAFFWNEW